MIQMVATDLDATLLVDNAIPERALQLMRAMHQKEIGVALVTGRMWKSALWYAQTASVPMHIIGCNGGVIAASDGRIRSFLPLDGAVLDRLLAYCHEHSLYYQLYDLDVVAMNGFCARTLERYAESSVPYAPMQAPVVIADRPLERLRNPAEVVKLVVKDDSRDRLASLRRDLEEFPGIAVSSSLGDNIELTHSRATKGIALQTLAKQTGVSVDSFLAIGDNENDISMFREAGVSVCMGNGDARALAAADAVTQSPEEGGWANAICRFLPEICE